MRAILLFVVCSLISIDIYCQNENESPYFENYTDDLTTRLYNVNKFNSIQFIGIPSDSTMTYRPNSNLNAGFGFTYRGFSLNFGFALPYLNRNKEKFGETRHLNWNMQNYGKKVNLTAFLETYQGYYLSENNSRGPALRNDIPIRLRGDLRFLNIGASGVYVFNYKKVSYRAAFTQDAWQKRSAGSPLLGAYASYMRARGDSALIHPRDLFPGEYNKISDMISIDIGPMIGYMYNFVINEHWFWLVSLSAGVGINSLAIYMDEVKIKEQGFQPNYRLQARTSLGYNSRRTYVGLSYVNENNRALVQYGRFGYNVGEFRFNINHRFTVKSLGFIDGLMDTFHWFFLSRTDKGNLE